MNWQHPLTWFGIGLNVLLVLIGVAWVNHELNRCQTMVADIEAADALYVERRPGLESELTELQARRTNLEARLATWRSRLDPMQNDPALVGRKDEEARIDFKVALFETRERLVKRADDLGLWIPEDLGLSETIDGDEDTETRLWQLVTVAHLIEGALNQNLPSIDYLKPLPPPPDTEGNVWVYREYPVEISLLCTYSEWLAALERFAKQHPYLALRHFRAEVNHPWPATMLSVESVYGGSRIDPVSKNEELTPGSALGLTTPGGGL